MRYNTLAKDIEKTLLDPDNTEAVKVRTDLVKPKVSTEQLAEKYPAILIVDRDTYKMPLFKNLKQKTYGIAVGQVGLETPPASTTSRTRRQPSLARPELRLGGRPRGQGHRR